MPVAPGVEQHAPVSTGLVDTDGPVCSPRWPPRQAGCAGRVGV